MDWRIEALDPSRIDLADSTYRISTAPVGPDLVASIARFGVMTPPIVRRRDDDTLQVVSGFRRIEAGRRAQVAEIRSRVLSGEMAHERFVTLAIGENAHQRPLNLLEQSRCLMLLWSLEPQPEALVRNAAELGWPAHRGVLLKIKRLGDLAPAIQEAIAEGVLSLPMATALGEMDPVEGERLARLFSELALSLGKQRELLRWLEEIAARDGLSIGRLLDDPPIAAIIGDPEKDRNLKAQRLRGHLRRRRFPSITGVESRFEGLVQALELPPHLRLIPPPDFEGETFCLNCRFASTEELRQCLQGLDRLCRSPLLGRILAKY
jgi:ParB-like chromosome segregation protein Spo0J